MEPRPGDGDSTGGDRRFARSFGEATFNGDGSLQNGRLSGAQIEELLVQSDRDAYNGSNGRDDHGSSKGREILGSVAVGEEEMLERGGIVFESRHRRDTNTLAARCGGERKADCCAASPRYANARCRLSW